MNLFKWLRQLYLDRLELQLTVNEMLCRSAYIKMRDAKPRQVIPVSEAEFKCVTGQSLYLPANIQSAIDRDEDTTGLCTVRELAAEMLKFPLINGRCWCEMVFVDAAGRRINIECEVTMVDGVRIKSSRSLRKLKLTGAGVRRWAAYMKNDNDLTAGIVWVILVILLGVYHRRS